MAATHRACRRWAGARRLDRARRRWADPPQNIDENGNTNGTSVIVPDPEDVPAGTLPAPAGMELVSAESDETSIEKSATANCPSGKKVLGAGAEITGGLGEVIVDEIVPLEGLSGVRVEAFEDGDYGGSWRVTAYAICASRVDGLVRRGLSSAHNGVDKSVLVGCTSDMVLLGAGAEITGGLGNVVIERMYPQTATDVMTREEDPPSSTVWTAKAYAICAPRSEVGTPFTAYGTSDYDSEDGKSATATCPPGRRVVGAGGKSSGGAGEIVMDDMTPSEDLESVTVKGYEIDPDYPDNWSVTAVAKCL